MLWPHCVHFSSAEPRTHFVKVYFISIPVPSSPAESAFPNPASIPSRTCPDTREVMGKLQARVTFSRTFKHGRKQGCDKKSRRLLGIPAYIAPSLVSQGVVLLGKLLLTVMTAPHSYHDAVPGKGGRTQPKPSPQP